MKLMFLGPPGAGKGTQAVRVATGYGLLHISTGDMLREQIKNDTALGQRAKAYIDAGGLVPDDVIIGMVRERIAQPDAADGFILDGFPRTLEQARALEAIAQLDAVFNIDVPEDALIRRISGRRVCRDCGAVHQVAELGGKDICPKCAGAMYVRDDDNVQTVRERLAVYRRQTQPLIEYYAQRGILHHMNGSETIADTNAQIAAVLDRMQ